MLKWPAKHRNFRDHNRAFRVKNLKGVRILWSAPPANARQVLKGNHGALFDLIRVPKSRLDEFVAKHKAIAQEEDPGILIRFMNRVRRALWVSPSDYELELLEMIQIGSTDFIFIEGD
jgi:hypothetical protein